MSEKKYYCYCETNCRYETLTREQILTAIAQAVSTGEIRDVDTGFVQTIKTINGQPLKFFVGTQSEYEALTAEEKQNLFAIITNDTAIESINEAIESLRASIAELQERLQDVADQGNIVVERIKNGSIPKSAPENQEYNKNTIYFPKSGYYYVEIGYGDNYANIPLGLVYVKRGEHNRFRYFLDSFYDNAKEAWVKETVTVHFSSEGKIVFFNGTREVGRVAVVPLWVEEE